MALRDENHFFTRRIADGGSDKIVFKSQDRKIQETDPKDVIWDEIIGKEEHPEDGGGYKFQETDSATFIRDEDDGKKVYPGGCSDIYLSPPCFDSYGDEEVSNEDYRWVTQALNGFVLQEGSVNQKSMKSSLHDLSYRDVVASDSVAKSIANNMVFLYLMSCIMDELNVCSIKEEIEEKVSQYFPLKSQNIFTAANCMDVKFTSICIHGLSKLVFDGRIEKQKVYMDESNKEIQFGFILVSFNLRFLDAEKIREGLESVDIYAPYDPGSGCGSEVCKTRGRVFSKRGRMMQETRDPTQPTMLFNLEVIF